MTESATHLAIHLAIHTDPASITPNLVEWQVTGEEACLEQVWHIASPIAHRMITASLHRLGILDPSAIDDALSLVLDHLRRLPETSTSDSLVARFAPRTDTRCTQGFADPGLAFIIWVSKKRAADVARARRRRNRHATVFSLLDQQTTTQVHAIAATSDDEASSAVLCLRLHEAIPRLPPRERLVIEMVLEGKSQDVIAHVLDVCAGTVSRLRARAIATLRDRLAE
jgi:RNA polymerase sigma factor (sigma-70 family)